MAADPAAAPRQRCFVPFCRRTRRDDGRFGEWICARHWREVPAKLKTIYRRARATEARVVQADARAYDDLVAVPEWQQLPETDPLVHLRVAAACKAALAIGRSRRLWSICRRRAIETAAGIASGGIG